MNRALRAFAAAAFAWLLLAQPSLGADDPVARGLAASAVRAGGTLNCSSVASLCLNLQSPVGTTVWGVSKTGAMQFGTDTFLQREAANTLALRNGVNPQTFNIYNTFTDASNYELGQLTWSANTFFIGTAAAGTGTGRNLGFSTSGVGRWTITSSGNLISASDGSYDFGGSGTGRARDIFNSRDHVLGRHLGSSGAAPAVTSCGTSPSIVGGDLAGEVTTGTATPTACTITFNVAYAAQPYCLVTDRSALANLTSYTVSTSAIVLTTTAASSQKVVYQCIGA